MACAPHSELCGLRAPTRPGRPRWSNLRASRSPSTTLSPPGAQTSPAVRPGDSRASFGGLFWEPLERQLAADTATVWIAPDGDLTRLPWAALPGRKPDGVLLEDLCPGRRPPRAVPARPVDGRPGIPIGIRTPPRGGRRELRSRPRSHGEGRHRRPGPIDRVGGEACGLRARAARDSLRTGRSVTAAQRVLVRQSC